MIAQHPSFLPSFGVCPRYLIIAGIPTCLVGNLSFLNMGLRDFDALLVVPIYQTYWTIAGTAGGFVYFNEIAEMDNLSKAMFIAGFVVAMVGIAILSSRAPPLEFKSSNGHNGASYRERDGSSGEGDHLTGTPQLAVTASFNSRLGGGSRSSSPSGYTLTDVTDDQEIA